MARAFPGPFFILLLGCAVCGLGSVIKKKFHFNQTPLSWLDAQKHCRRFYSHDCERPYFFLCDDTKFPSFHERVYFVYPVKTWLKAQEYCRTYYTDLVTFRDYDTKNFSLSLRNFQVWIGLHRDTDGETWEWSTGMSDYRNWQYEGNYDCVSISSMNKTMATQDCSTLLPFICYSDNLLLVKENKTWLEALEHCRAIEALDPNNPLLYRNYRYDLVSMNSEGDHLYMWGRIKDATTDQVWTGLCFLAGQWRWVNGVQGLYQEAPPCPAQDQRCGALSKHNSTALETRNCTEKRNFLCYKK
ncbi:secretory phospholipase A2 receptor-like [Lampris incognitus]|uniref:secretory phospholipase A2 receptor-like n=1 Tax=Lampris incognitus TaxID=2546036 RepID=UPI0024B5DA65|nr:secretory phospholipase A2 receptor-like [Lampris incognitus]